MRIADIRAVPVSFPVPADKSVRLGIGRSVKRDAVLVRVETDEFDALVTSIRERGVSLFGEIKETDEGRFTGFCDPDGNLFEVVEIVQSAE